MESWRDLFSTFVFWSTFAVVIGCAIEVPELVAEHWPKVFPENWISRTKLLSSFGLLLVILGVAGELAFEHWVSRYEALLQTLNSVLLREAELEAGIARSSALEASSAASSANDSAKNASALANTARKEADSFEKDILAAKLAATQAESQVEEAKIRAATAEKNLLEFKEKIRGRYISEEQRKKFLDLVRGKARRERINIRCLMGDSESLSFADDLRKLLQDAGWTVPEVVQIKTLPDPGVLLTVVSVVPIIDNHDGTILLPETSAVTYGGIVFDALKNINIRVTARFDSASKQLDQGDSVGIFVGSKP